MNVGNFNEAGPRPRAAAEHALEADSARRLWNESFFSAPQLKRIPLRGQNVQKGDHDEK